VTSQKSRGRVAKFFLKLLDKLTESHIQGGDRGNWSTYYPDVWMRELRDGRHAPHIQRKRKPQ